MSQDVGLSPSFNTNADFFILNRSLLVQSPATLKPTIPPVLQRSMHAAIRWLGCTEAINWRRLVGFRESDASKPSE